MGYRELFHWKEVVGFLFALGSGVGFYLRADCEVRNVLTLMITLWALWISIPLLKQVREYEALYRSCNKNIKED